MKKTLVEINCCQNAPNSLKMSRQLKFALKPEQTEFLRGIFSPLANLSFKNQMDSMLNL
jgi:hypothetical protein